MNPLFAAHIVADFLLQPKWLVSWKEHRMAGTVVHAAIHAVLMGLFLLPNRFDLGIYLFAIAALHGIIDQLKIRFQKIHASFELPFLFDQLSHLLVLLAANFLFPFALPFWHSEAGKGILILLFIFSFAIAWVNLSHIPKYPLKTQGQRLTRLLSLSLVFLMFFLPSRLLAVSSCSWL